MGQCSARGRGRERFAREGTGLAIFNRVTEDFCRMRFCFFFLVSIVSAFPPLVANTDPPQAPEKPHEIEELGKKRNDPFFWLRDKQNPDVLKYLESENRYTEKSLRRSRNFKEALYKEMRARINEEDLSVPERIGDFYYYARTDTGKQTAIHC